MLVFRCATEFDYCVNDNGCYHMMICESQANCTGPGCYKPETCQRTIDDWGVGSGSAMMAEVLDACVRRSGCALLETGIH